MVNSHYVPQFILRNFYVDDKISYCDLQERKVQLRNTRSIFSEEGYYPEDLEKDLCKKAEYQFANLFHNKLEHATNSVSLTTEEVFTLKKFLAVTALRFKHEISNEDHELIEKLGPAFKIDYDRSLREILLCENIEDALNVMNSSLKFYEEAMMGKELKDMEGYNLCLATEIREILYSYIVFVRARGEEKFLIPDVGRGCYDSPLGMRKMTALLEGVMKTGDPQILTLMQFVGVRDYYIYPVSKDLAILTMNPFFMLFADGTLHRNVILPEECPTLSAVLGFGDSNTIAPPKLKRSGQSSEQRYEIRSITSDDVSHLNCVMIGGAKRYIAFSEIESIQKSAKRMTDFSDRDCSFMMI